MTSIQELIILFTKYPRPGSSKTRLIPALGPTGAADLQRWMTKAISSKIRKITVARPCHSRIYFTGACVTEMKQLLGDDLVYRQQQGTGLGQRMTHAITRHLKKYRAILLLGADCPDVETTTLIDGLEKLRTNQVVIGPTHDGGYYLIGVRGDITQGDLQHLFSNVSWGSENVFNQTIERIQSLAIRHELLRKLHDIDTPQDLKHLHYYPDLE